MYGFKGDILLLHAFCTTIAGYYMWLDLRKPDFHAQSQMFRNTEFNYLKYYNSGRETDACMKFATIL